MAYDPSRKLVPDLSTYPIPPPPKRGDPGVEQWILNMWEGHGFTFYQACDSLDTHRQAVNVASDLVAKSEQGDLKALRTTIDQLRTKAPFDRPLFWLAINSDSRMWKGAYEAGHWHVIEYLVKDLGFSLTSTLPADWYLPEAVVERAASNTGSIEEMQRLLDLGWNINEMPGKSPYNFRNRMYFPCGGPLGVSTFSYLCMNENLVRWYLANGGSPFPTVLVEASRISPLPILKILIEHGGNVEDSRLVAEAALGDWWGYPDRVSVVNYLLDLGAPIDHTTWCTWPPKKPQYPLRECTTLFEGEKTAYQIARLTRNDELENLLSQRGANTMVGTDVHEETAKN